LFSREIFSLSLLFRELLAGSSVICCSSRQKVYRVPRGSYRLWTVQLTLAITRPQRNGN
jgi:hypothetical protein